MDKPEDSSWWPSKSTLIVFGIAISAALGVWLWANYGSGAPTDPSSSTTQHTNILGSIKNVSINAWNNSIDGVRFVWSNLADVYERVRHGNLHITDQSVDRLAELKSTAAGKQPVRGIPVPESVDSTVPSPKITAISMPREWVDNTVQTDGNVLVEPSTIEE